MKSLISEGAQATANTLGAAAVGAAIGIPARIVRVQEVSRNVISTTRSYASERIQSFNKNNFFNKGGPK
jgi:hypothetical protein